MIPAEYTDSLYTGTSFIIRKIVTYPKTEIIDLNQSFQSPSTFTLFFPRKETLLSSLFIIIYIRLQK